MASGVGSSVIRPEARPRGAIRAPAPRDRPVDWPRDGSGRAAAAAVGAGPSAREPRLAAAGHREHRAAVGGPGRAGPVRPRRRERRPQHRAGRGRAGRVHRGVGQSAGHLGRRPAPCLRAIRPPAAGRRCRSTDHRSSPASAPRRVAAARRSSPPARRSSRPRCTTATARSRGSVAPPAARGVWLATDVADALGVQVGDPVRVGLKVLNFGVAAGHDRGGRHVRPRRRLGAARPAGRGPRDLGEGPGLGPGPSRGGAAVDDRRPGHLRSAGAQDPPAAAVDRRPGPARRRHPPAGPEGRHGRAAARPARVRRHDSARRRDQHGQAPRDPAVDRVRPPRHRHRCA